MIKDNVESVCFVTKITEIKAIEGADKIEQVMLGDWSCISSKGTHKVGDLVIAITHDAVIPIEISEKMNITNYLRKQRVKTIRLRGVYSECVIMNTDQLIEILPDIDVHIVKEGRDLEKYLDIYKYQEPEKEVLNTQGKKVKYSENPLFEVYTKFPNVKNVGEAFFSLSDSVQVQSKRHGTNFRFGIVPILNVSWWMKILNFLGLKKKQTHEFVFGSHHVNISYRQNYTGFYNTNVYSDIIKKYDLEIMAWLAFEEFEIEESIVFYGEIYGPGIQKNYDYNLKEINYELFDIKINGSYEDPDTVKSLCKTYKTKLTQVLADYISYSEFLESKDHYIKRYIPGTAIPEEGVVVKLCDQDGAGLKAIKFINPEYHDYSAKHDVSENH
tara:strand:- start:16870 stop:18024 length:1155 start_codon:yes stop_codon:yes gene_type:complete